MEARLYDKYVTEVVPALQQKFGYKNVNQIPKIDKVVLNMGLGDCKDNPKGRISLCRSFDNGCDGAVFRCSADRRKINKII